MIEPDIWSTDVRLEFENLKNITFGADAFAFPNDSVVLPDDLKWIVYIYIVVDECLEILRYFVVSRLLYRDVCGD